MIHDKVDQWRRGRSLDKVVHAGKLHWTSKDNCTMLHSCFVFFDVLLYVFCACVITSLQCESKKIPPRGPDIFSFFHQRLRICKRFFTHLLNVPIFARLQIFIQLSPILMKLCHIKRDYPVHIICAKYPKRTKTRAFRRLRKSLIALLIVVCGK